MSEKVSDYILHPPCGSNVPGKVDANRYMNMAPNDLRKLIHTEKNSEELKKIISALKQWERQYQWPGYHFLKPVTLSIRRVAASLRNAEIVGPSINLPYYQDAEVPEGYEGILESLTGLYDNYDMSKFDYNRQGERPETDSDYSVGDFLSPKSPILDTVDVVKPDGEGPDPEGMEIPLPATGGDPDALPDMLL